MWRLLVAALVLFGLVGPVLAETIEYGFIQPLSFYEPSWRTYYELVGEDGRIYRFIIKVKYGTLERNGTRTIRAGDMPAVEFSFVDMKPDPTYKTK